MSRRTFKQFLREHWKDYLLPVGGPLVVFTISMFVTNGGWRLLIVGPVVLVIMCALTTWTLYNQWYAIEGMMDMIRNQSELLKEMGKNLGKGPDG